MLSPDGSFLFSAKATISIPNSTTFIDFAVVQSYRTYMTSLNRRVNYGNRPSHFPLILPLLQPTFCNGELAKI